MTVLGDITIARLLAEGHRARVRWRMAGPRADRRVHTLTIEADHFRTSVEMTDAAWHGLVQRNILEAPGGRVQLGINGHSLLSRLEREERE